MTKRASKDKPAANGPGQPATQTEVDSLQRGLEILRSFRTGEKSLQLADILERTKIPRLSAQKLLKTLTAHHFLRYLPELGRYEPDVSCFVIGHALRASLPILRVARPIMRALADELGLDVLLASREGMEMMIVEYCSTRADATEFSVGSLVPLARSAVGRAWLWAQKPAIQGEYIERIRAEADTSALGAIPGIYRAFQDLAERGYCLSLGERLQDRHMIATSLIVGGEREVLALAALATAQRLRESTLRDFIASALVDAAARIKNEMPRTGSE
jgi:IclR family transcriptional regulator, positive regulator for flagellar biogenesis